jgi:hypothetical protein
LRRFRIDFRSPAGSYRRVPTDCPTLVIARKPQRIARIKRQQAMLAHLNCLRIIDHTPRPSDPEELRAGPKPQTRFRR